MMRTGNAPAIPSMRSSGPIAILRRLDAAALAQSRAFEMAALAGIFVLGAAIRLYHLGTWSLWIDEVFTLQSAQRALANFSITTPISTLLTALAIRQLGTGAFALRLVPMLIGLLSIPVLYFPARRLFGIPVALLATLLLALSPWHVDWSQNARFYTAMLLFSALSLYAFYFWMEKNRLGYLAISIVMLGLAVLERKTALLFAPVVVAYLGSLFLLRWEKPAGLTWKNILLITAIPVLLFGLYQFYDVVLAGKPSFFENFSTEFDQYSRDPLRILLSIIYVLGLPMSVLAVFGSLSLFLKRSRPGLFLAMNAFVPVVLIVLASPLTRTAARYTFQSLPFWTILAAYALVELWGAVKGNPRLLVAGVLVLTLADPISQLVLYNTSESGHRTDWKTGFAVVQAKQQPGDVVITSRVEMGEYYLNQPVESSAGVSPQMVMRSGKRTWLVLDDRTEFVSADLVYWLEQNGYLYATSDVTYTGKTLQMRVYLYEPPPQ